MVEWLTWSNISHVGIVLVDPDYIEKDLRGRFLFESGREDIPDVITHKMIWGVQLTELDALISAYPGRIYRRRITTSMTHEKLLAITRVYHDIYDMPYDAKLTDFLRAATGLTLGSDCQRTNSFFCSAFVGYLFTQLGLFDKTVRFDLLRPKDFTPGYAVDKMIKGGCLQDMERIK